VEKNIRDVPSALERRAEIATHLQGKRVAVFLDYDGTLTPIVSRPEDALLSPHNREIVRALAERCTVAIISGRDRPDVQELVGLDNLIYAGSHGFDIAGPGGRSIQNDMGAGFSDLLLRVQKRLEQELAGIEGSLIEPKKSSVAVHYRLVPDEEGRQRIKDVVDGILADHSDLRNKPGKMVWDIQPEIDWDKGKAVLWLLEALGLDSPDVLPMYLGDDITDEDAFRALKGRGLAIFVGHEEAEGGKRATAADYVLKDPDEVGTFLENLPPA
jgi:trehalose 6-phosphate phosphatase